jgi:hypothetical protein
VEQLGRQNAADVLGTIETIIFKDQDASVQREAVETLLRFPDDRLADHWQCLGG